MILGVDAHRLCGARLGVGRYLEYLLAQWRRLDHPFRAIHLFAPCDVSSATDARDDRMHARTTGASVPLFLFHNLLLPHRARDVDLLFCPAYFAPIRFRRPYVVTHHGSYEAIAHMFPWWHRYRYSAFYAHAARGARRVITVSESSKRDIVRFYQIDPEKIHVIYPGVDDRFFVRPDAAAIDRVRHALGLGDRQLVLYVGKLTARRNVLPLIEAFVSLKTETGLPHVLVLVGPNELGGAIRRILRSPNAQAAVRHVPYLDHESIGALYHTSDLFVYPSAYEGFGLPVIEAMAAGTPVITVDSTAFKETASGAAVLVPDGSAASLADALRRVIGDAALRRELGARGVDRARQFTWTRCARETMDVLVDAARC